MCRILSNQVSLKVRMADRQRGALPGETRPVDEELEMYRTQGPISFAIALRVSPKPGHRPVSLRIDRLSILLLH